jgi:RIO kinase 1
MFRTQEIVLEATQEDGDAWYKGEYTGEYDERDEDDYDEDEYDLRFSKLYQGTGMTDTLTSAKAGTTKTEKLSKKLDNKIYLDKVSSKTKLSKLASNNLERSEKMTHTKVAKHTGRDDRATNESVLDPRTRLILFKFLNTGRLKEINGCISTGKEANVYHAVGKAWQEMENEAGAQPVAGTPNAAELAEDEDAMADYAIKVYKTSILGFKDRDKYVQGNHRFTNYCKKNPRKMVKVWAEKEMRNLKRLQQAGIPSPRPLQLRSHVLLMDFIGHDGWPAPRLHDAKLNENQLRKAYIQCVIHMRTMYLKCRMVHADLSEFNMLWYRNTLYIIDVSQSVEHEHPHATDFLRKDCSNVTHWFSKPRSFEVSAKELKKRDKALQDSRPAGVVEKDADAPKIDFAGNDLIDDEYDYGSGGPVVRETIQLPTMSIRELFDFVTDFDLKVKT